MVKKAVIEICGIQPKANFKSKTNERYRGWHGIDKISPKLEKNNGNVWAVEKKFNHKQYEGVMNIS